MPDRFEADDFAGNGGAARGSSREAAAGATADRTQTATRTARQRPSFGMTLVTVLLPVVLMMGKALADIFIDDENNPLRQVLDILGTPLIALLIAVIVAMFTLGRGAGMTREQITRCSRRRCRPSPASC